MWTNISGNSSVITSNSRFPEFQSILELVDQLFELKEQGSDANITRLVGVINRLFTSLSAYIEPQKGHQNPTPFEQHILRASGEFGFSVPSFESAFGNLENCLMRINGRTLFPDENLQVNQVFDQNGHPLYYLKLYGTNVFPISPNSPNDPVQIEIIKRGVNFVQPSEFIYPVSETTLQNINFRIDFRHFDGRTETKFMTISKNEWKTYLLKLNPEVIYSKTVQVLPDSQTALITSEEIKINLNDTNFLQFVARNEDNNTDIEWVVREIKTFMWLVIILEAPVSGLYEALNANLTLTGASQCDILQAQLMQIFQIYQSEERYYAPFTSLIQSSGFGKSKLCVELLKRIPGVYLVFRKKGDTGIPRQKTWMGDLALFVAGAATDELPLQLPEILECRAMDYTPGRFLIVLNELINTYFNNYSNFRTTSPNIQRQTVLNDLGGHMLLEHAATGGARVDIEVIIPQNDDRTIGQVLRSINTYVNAFSQITGSHELEENIYFRELMMPEPDSKFPFLLFIDEIDNLNELISPGRVPMVNVIRRALHLLDLDTRLLVVAIGTNCDALDFSPAIRDNSLRILTRRHLLPPFILSSNWDIFFDLENNNRDEQQKNALRAAFEELELPRDILLNRAMFNVLVAMGRPLWSSCPLSEVVKIGQAKLRNGSGSCIGSKLTLLMARSSLTINVHHVLSRSLIKSYMIIVNYISSNAHEMKIGYSSEPVLAMASRNILHDHINREIAFRALLEFVEKQAIDKGRIVETILQHLCLFAIDDAPCTPQNIVFSDNPETVPEFFRPLCAHKSHILETQEEIRSQNPMDYSIARAQNYKVRSVAACLESLLKPQVFEQIAHMIPPKILNGLINCSHFINLDRLKPGDFDGLLKTSIPSDMKQNIIDRSILKCGLLRQCGFVFPEGYFAFDHMIPCLLDDASNSDGRPVYSFIGVQSKSSKQSIHSCAIKMAANLHLIQEPPQAQGVTSISSAKFEVDEMAVIAQNQLVILLSLNNPNKTTRSRAYWEVAIKGHTIPVSASELTKELNIHAAQVAKDLILNAAYTDPVYTAYLPADRNSVSPTSYPKFSKTSETLKPDLILTFHVNSDISVQKMIWKANRVRILTCVVCHDVRSLGHLVTDNSVVIMKRIANHTASVFDDVDSVHLGIVQHSSLYGKFSGYHELNPMLRRMRGLEPVKGITAAYFNNLTATSLENSIARCIVGPVDMQLPPLPSTYHRQDRVILEQEQYQDQDMEDIDFIDLDPQSLSVNMEVD